MIATTNRGSPPYAAPESRDPNDHTPKMDVFSLLMVELCLGEFPEPTEVLGDWPDMVTLIRRCISG